MFVPFLPVQRVCRKEQGKGKKFFKEFSSMKMFLNAQAQKE